MADDDQKPWEKYAAQQAAPEAEHGPWEKYAAQDQSGDSTSSATGAQPSLIDTLKSNWHSNTDEIPNPNNSIAIGAQNIARGAARGIGHILAHPIEALSNSPSLSATPTPMTMGANADASQQAQQQAVQQGATNIQAQIQEAKEHPAYTAGGIVGPMLLGEGLKGTVRIPGEVSNIADRARNYLRPISSPSVVPRSEFAARQLSAAVLPASKDASNFIQAASQEVPNILEYAKRTGNPLNTQLEFSKAAAGYAQEVRNFYQNDILGPSHDTLVKTSGTGFGQRMGEGPDTYATLGQIDQRIVDINKQLDAPSLNADDARRALASKTALQQEASSLRNILHNTLAKSTGLAPDQIADIRQRVGRSYELANDTNAAVTQRMQAEGKADLQPITAGQIPSIAINKYLRGGPVSIADRAFQKAIQNFPGKNQPLPMVNPPAESPNLPSRTPVWQNIGINAGKPDIPQPLPDTEGAQRIVKQITDRNAARDAQAATNRFAALQEFLHANDLEQAAQDAALERSQRVQGFKESRAALEAARQKLLGEILRNKKAPPLD